MIEKRAEKILEALRKNFTLPKWISSRHDPFETLIITIISQNTSDRNTAKAFENLSKKFPISPKKLANAETKEIEECLRVAGLYRNKARVIKEISKIVLEKFGDSLTPILSMPFENARETLMQLPGVGPKTADVLLLFSANQPTVPVDTHVNRVSKRLGLAPVNGDYEAVRNSLQLLYKPKDYLEIHILLILLGRKYCKARNPLCKPCPVNTLCPSRRS
ncbi:MAG: endonuclease III [Candidatus Bathyarchaeota archaeon]|jgi:endonuclease-3|nr:endonuclease III [Candidatus Bathyarchaeota archaeon A05DMB-3]MDH7606420.1 endonuclease III [Candidatus Bathyarchaeota archaeon]PMB74304.1 MAG: endonuclease III [Candidatus Bathyarchaeota archaeon]